MSFQPVSSLKSRTFIGLLVAQFLAAFNDQAIHASAMFFAMNHKAMTESDAISLMPILFYAPWAIFCTLAGWLADRYSKRQSLVFWKIAEVGITLTALLGFWLGTLHPHSPVGPWIVLSTVFLMGTHSAFFVPAKYGAMPEILPPHLLSKGNGLLESLSFLAVILGTVSGGVLSFVFKDQEYLIGFVLVTLALIGAAASFLIQKMPAANPNRPFPRNLFKPLFANLRVMIRSKPLYLAVLGIAFFTFMVAFMRGTMYMHGETRNPRWDELHTSIVVGVVALGVGLGSPLAGFLSGGKIELGLVPLGSVGMIVCLALAALLLNIEAALIGCLIGIGFFTGFYIVPLFTLLQHRAPKASKGDLLASSNFINVTGAIAASVLFKVLVIGAQWSGITPAIPIKEVARGELVKLEYKDGRPSKFEVTVPDQQPFVKVAVIKRKADEDIERTVVEEEGHPEPGSEVVVGQYRLRHEGHGIYYYRVQPADEPLGVAYDKEPLTRYLFLGAALMTFGVLVLLCRQMPDFFVRALLWLRAQGRYRLHVVGLHNLPTDGPVILATNCESFEDCMHVVAATDRFTRFLFPEKTTDGKVGPLLGYLARRTGLISLPADSRSEAYARAVAKGARSLALGNMIGLAADAAEPTGEAEAILQRLQAHGPAAIVPVFCANGSADLPVEAGGLRGVRVVLGAALKGDVGVADIRQAIQALSDGVEMDHAEIEAMP
jgi:MFS family permease